MTHSTRPCDTHSADFNLNVAPASEVTPYSPLRFPRSMLLQCSTRHVTRATLSGKGTRIAIKAHSLDLPQKLRAVKRRDGIVREVQGPGMKHQSVSAGRQINRRRANWHVRRHGVQTTGNRGPHPQSVKLNVTSASVAMRLKLRSSSLRGSFNCVSAHANSRSQSQQNPLEG
jgi:hypothetical protein